MFALTNMGMWMNRWGIRALLVTLLLQLIFHSRGKVSADGIRSTWIVKDRGGNEVGPRIELSDTVLETDGKLKFTCREGTDAELNTLVLVLPNGGFQQIENSAFVGGGNTNGKKCNTDGDPDFECTINDGEVNWSKDKGGRYACSAYLEEAYIIHWIDPVARVPASKDYDMSVYGTAVQYSCSVDMTPTNINYGKITPMDWEWKGAKTKYRWTALKNNVNGVKYQADATGPTSTLEIQNFNPVNHGGSYRCSVGVLRYDTLLSEDFTVESKPRATLKNNKRIKFHFGLDETFKITCFAESYPFASSVEFKVQGKLINNNYPGIEDYEVETLAINVDRHFAHFTVVNASAAFPQNDSLLECKVLRDDGAVHLTQVQMLFFEETPPEIFTVSPGNPDAKIRIEPTRPWVIAIAVIIPIVILLIVAVLLVWKCKKSSGTNEGGNIYQTPINDMNRGPYADHRSLRSQRSQQHRFADNQSVNSQSTYMGSQYGRGRHNGTYAAPSVAPSVAPSTTYGRVEQNPLYGSHYGRGGQLPLLPKEQIHRQGSEEHYGEVDDEMLYKPSSNKQHGSSRADPTYASSASVKRY